MKSNFIVPVYMYAFVVILLLLVILRLLATSRRIAPVIKETYAEGRWSGFNVVPNFKGYNLQFAEDVKQNSVSVYARSVPSSTTNNGSCKTYTGKYGIGDKNVNSVAKVTEGDIPYYLTHTCIAMYQSKIQLAGSLAQVSVILTDKSTPKHIGYLYLKNPVFIQFNKSYPYSMWYDANTSLLSNWNGKGRGQDDKKNYSRAENKTHTLLLKRIDQNNTMFKDITGSTYLSRETNKLLNVKIYNLVRDPAKKYEVPLLRNLTSSSQTQEVMNLVFKKSDNAPINMNSSVELALQEFWQKIGIQLKNKQPFTLTFKFQLNFKKVLRTTEVFRVYSSYGTNNFGKDASNIYIPDDKLKGGVTHKNNILSVVLVRHSAEKFLLRFVTQTGTLENFGSRELELWLPYNENKENVFNITTSVHPYHKIALATWKSNNLYKFKRTTSENEAKITNDFQTLVNAGNAAAQHDIMWSYNPSFVKITPNNKMFLGHYDFTEDVDF